MSDFPSQKQDKFVLRLPDGLRDRIRAKAEKNGRSMNAEIIQLLEREYPEPSDVMHVHVENIKKALDLYEKETDPRQRLYYQKLVEIMVTAGEDLSFDDEDEFS
ncbi:Arc family DNA-binding protein [Sulfitobacter pontiacus]|uniref:Arc family DNA-binding protein n=1 Tax=Sulfitobacter pontiacus TaxID=60137 RepID=UPI0030EC465E